MPRKFSISEHLHRPKCDDRDDHVRVYDDYIRDVHDGHDDLCENDLHDEHDDRDGHDDRDDRDGHDDRDDRDGHDGDVQQLELEQIL